MEHDDLLNGVYRLFEEIVGSLGTYGGNPVTLPVQYDNKEFSKVSGSPWSRFFVRDAASQQKSFGATGTRRFRKSGIVTIMVYVPLNTGTGLADYIVSKIEQGMTGVTKYGVTFRSPKIPDGKRIGEEWVVTVTIPYYSDRLA